MNITSMITGTAGLTLGIVAAPATMVVGMFGATIVYRISNKLPKDGIRQLLFGSTAAALIYCMDNSAFGTGVKIATVAMSLLPAAFLSNLDPAKDLIEDSSVLDRKLKGCVLGGTIAVVAGSVTNALCALGAGTFAAYQYSKKQD